MGKVALVETEFIIIIIVLVGLAIVVHGRYRDGQLVNGCGIDLVHVDGDLGVADLLDTCDIGNSVAGLNTLLILGVEEIRQGLVRLLGIGCCHRVAFVLFKDGVPEVSCGSVVIKGVAPVCSAGCYGIALGVIPVCDAVVNDALGELLACCRKVCVPEGILLFLGPLGEVSIVLAGCCEQGKEA